MLFPVGGWRLVELPQEEEEEEEEEEEVMWSRLKEMRKPDQFVLSEKQKPQQLSCRLLSETIRPATAHQ